MEPKQEESPRFTAVSVRHKPLSLEQKYQLLRGDSTRDTKQLACDNNDITRRRPVPPRESRSSNISGTPHLFHGQLHNRWELALPRERFVGRGDEPHQLAPAVGRCQPGKKKRHARSPLPWLVDTQQPAAREIVERVRRPTF